MRWYEYKMETEDLHAPDDLKARLLAMTDQLTEEEKEQPMMKAPVKAEKPVKKHNTIRFPAKQLGALAACLAVCAVGFGTLRLGIGMGSAKSSAPALYAAEGAANSSAASAAAGDLDLQCAMLDAPDVVSYSMDGVDDRSADGGAETYSAEGTAAERSSTDSAKIIYTANLTLESKDYDAARTALDEALAQAGGWLEASSEYTRQADSRSVSLTCRVPQANYQSFLDAVAQAGNVTYKTQQAEDVTAQYLDVSARLDTLKAQRTRLQELQAQAKDLSDLLEIESTLTDVQSQIESWQSQLNWYSDQVQQCTVYVDLNEVQTYSPPSEGFGSRIASAFAEGWQNFVQGAQRLAVSLAGAWPAVVLLAAAVAVALHLRKKKTK